MCGDCFVCIYLVCQCDGLELGRRNRRITVRGVAVRINTMNVTIIFGVIAIFANSHLVINHIIITIVSVTFLLGVIAISLYNI